MVAADSVTVVTVIVVAAETVDTIRRLRPNHTVNRTPAGGAGRGERLGGAGYLPR